MDFENIIYDELQIGRIKSGQYTFVNGYYYYNNNVIKIRYDLVLQNKDIEYETSQILNTYLDCFILEPYERVRTDTPLNSYNSHRFGYIITDLRRQNSLRVLIMPYLHERRIYMN
jgi:hypothetical protein